MGGKGAQAQNSQMVQFEMEQARKAEQKEADRQARLDKGMKSISEVFHGKEKMGTGKAKLTGLAGLNPTMGTAPTGEIIQTGFQNHPGTQATSARANLGDTGWQWGTITAPWGPGYGVYDPQGNLQGGGWAWQNVVEQLEGREYDKPMGTGEFESDPFAPIKGKYKSSLTDLHNANISKTYNKALDETIYATARAGQMGSSTARDALADIGGANYEKQADGTFKQVNYGQYGDAKTKAVGDIDKSIADLTTQIQSAEDSAEQQLYMTEDPEKAAIAAKTLAGNIPAVPQYNSLGDMFKPLVIGATGFYSGYQGQNALNNAGFPQSKSPLGSGSAKTSDS